MTGSERPSPEPLLKKKRRPQPYWGGDNSGNALEASNALNYRVWAIPAVLSTGIPGKALRAFPVSFRNFSGISSGNSQPYWGCGLKMRCQETTMTISAVVGVSVVTATPLKLKPPFSSSWALAGTLRFYCDFCGEKLAASKLWLPIASDLGLRSCGSPTLTLQSLLFFDFLAFFLFQGFRGGVPQREKPLLFRGFPCSFFSPPPQKKARAGGSGKCRTQPIIYELSVRGAGGVHALKHKNVSVMLWAVRSINLH